jgi:hypothetical protein
MFSDSIKVTNPEFSEKTQSLINIKKAHTCVSDSQPEKKR